MKREKRLGKGLDSLISPVTPEARKDEQGRLLDLPLDQVRPNPYQPRTAFEDAAIDELADSLGRNGLLQPVVVRRRGSGFEMVNGERRLRAARKAGLGTLPALVREVDDSQMLTLALVENLQRADLNPIEKAKAFRELMQRFGLTQQEVAERVGLDRSSVANMIRLLELPEAVQHDVSRGTLSMGHARALLSLNDPARRIELAERVKRNALSVRRLERLVAGETGPVRRTQKPPHLLDLERRLREKIGGKVEVAERHGRGRIVIHFSDLDDLDRVLGVLGV